MQAEVPPGSTTPRDGVGWSTSVGQRGHRSTSVWTMKSRKGVAQVPPQGCRSEARLELGRCGFVNREPGDAVAFPTTFNVASADSAHSRFELCQRSRRPNREAGASS